MSPPKVISADQQLKMATTKKGGTSTSKAASNPKKDQTKYTHHPSDNDVKHHNKLQDACIRGHLDDAKKAVDDNKESLWSKDPEGNLPVHLAIRHGHKDVASYLIEKYPEGLKDFNKSKLSPIHLAINQEHEALLKEKSSGRTAKDNVPKFEGMLQTILKYQPDKLIKFTNEEGLTPLSYAAYNGYVDIVGYLIEKHPKSIKYANIDKSYPIHKACEGGHVEVLKKFQSKYPDSFGNKDERGQTILHLAAKQSKLKPIVEYLLSVEEGKKLINQKDQLDKKPSEVAKECKNNGDVVKLLEKAEQDNKN